MPGLAKLSIRLRPRMVAPMHLCLTGSSKSSPRWAVDPSAPSSPSSPIPPISPNGDTADMKRASISLPDDLAKALDDYIEAQEVRPAVTTVMQAALRQYLGTRGFLRERRTSKTSKRTTRSQS
jgi:hypothetical protein